jgi:hypothetical protein
MMIAKSRMEVLLAMLGAKLSLVVSLGVSTLLSEGHYSAVLHSA